MNQAKKIVQRRSYPRRARVIALMKKEDSKGLDRLEALELRRLQGEGVNWAFNELTRNPPSPNELRHWDMLLKKIRRRLHSGK